MTGCGTLLALLTHGGAANVAPPVYACGFSDNTGFSHLKGDLVEFLAVAIALPLDLEKSCDTIVLEYRRIWEPQFVQHIVLNRVNFKHGTLYVADLHGLFLAQRGCWHRTGCAFVKRTGSGLASATSLVPFPSKLTRRQFEVFRYLREPKWLDQLPAHAPFALPFPSLPAASRVCYDIDKLARRCEANKCMTDISWTVGQLPRRVKLNDLDWFILEDALAEEVLLYFCGGVPRFHVGHLYTGRIDSLKSGNQVERIFSRM